jgi:threonine/homoserine efflux transporter RhtA
MLFLALGSTVAGMLLWNRAIVRGGSTRISRLLYLEPVVSVLGAMVFLGERATAAVLAGGALVIAGVLVTRDSASGRKPPASVAKALEVHDRSSGLVAITTKTDERSAATGPAGAV